MADMTPSAEPRKVEKTRAANGVRRVAPPVDIFENQDGFLILADVPGVEPDGLAIEYNPPELSVAARPVHGGVAYERRFELGNGIDPQSIEAELRNGVLSIQLKKSASVRPRRIEVKAS